MTGKLCLSLLTCLLLISACKDREPWNSPYPTGLAKQNILFTAFAAQPKSLDPAKSFSADSNLFISQIYEPPLQYHYLKRPLHLVPLTTTAPPTVTYLDTQGQPVEATSDKIASTRYTLSLRNDMRYQPHPALARQANGQPRYLGLDQSELAHIHQLSDFSQLDSRLVTAADYAYQIKRLASPKVNSPIFALMSKHILGLKQLRQDLQDAINQNPKLGDTSHFLDLRKFDLPGVKVIDATHLQITLTDNYPQFRYWLAMTFFSPIPWEADAFYSQPGMAKRNLGFDWVPIGSGPYRLSLNDPNRAMMLVRNPNFHGETYPTEGMPDDRTNGLLDNAGKPLPFIDAFLFTLEKESIPRWHKFLQGYYDSSGISSDNFDQAIQLRPDGSAELSPAMQAKGLTLRTAASPSIFFLGFNMLDSTVGGYTPQHCALRQAIAIAVDYDEYIRIFLNGRGKLAHSPIPDQVWTSDHDNPITHTNGHRRTIAEAKALLTQAGYPNGINPKTGKALVLHYDITGSNGPDDKAQFDWMRKQFAKIGVALDIRATQYNRFQDKLRTGNFQMYGLGWIADYPDPENFLFLLYGPNSKVQFNGENASNYNNPDYNRLFVKMRNLPPGPERDALIHEMVGILRNDSPWLWGYTPLSFIMGHQWMHSVKTNGMGAGNFKYYQLDPALRAQQQSKWNRPTLWPLWLLLGLMGMVAIPAYLSYHRRQGNPILRRWQ